MSEVQEEYAAILLERGRVLGGLLGARNEKEKAMVMELNLRVESQNEHRD